jgi:hypothetical protein
LPNFVQKIILKYIFENPMMLIKELEFINYFVEEEYMESIIFGPERISRA